MGATGFELVQEMQGPWSSAELQGSLVVKD